MGCSRFSGKPRKKEQIAPTNQIPSIRLCQNLEKKIEFNHFIPLLWNVCGEKTQLKKTQLKLNLNSQICFGGASSAFGLGSDLRHTSKTSFSSFSASTFSFPGFSGSGIFSSLPFPAGCWLPLLLLRQGWIQRELKT